MQRDPPTPPCPRGILGQGEVATVTEAHDAIVVVLFLSLVADVVSISTDVDDGCRANAF